MNRLIMPSVAFCVALLSIPSHVQAITIDFDTDANGQPINAPDLFMNATRLDDLYASVGVTFSGPGVNDGGAILNQSGEFGVNARSGINFLGFNERPDADMQDGGLPVGPETITFAIPISSASVFFGDHVTVTLKMDAFNALNQLVGSNTQTSSTDNYAQLSVSGTNIVRLTVTKLDFATRYWVLDDLTFTPVPEPSALALAALGIVGLLMAARRRGVQN